MSASTSYSGPVKDPLSKAWSHGANPYNWALKPTAKVTGGLAKATFNYAWANVWPFKGVVEVQKNFYKMEVTNLGQVASAAETLYQTANSSKSQIKDAQRRIDTIKDKLPKNHERAVATSKAISAGNLKTAKKELRKLSNSLKSDLKACNKNIKHLRESISGRLDPSTSDLVGGIDAKFDAYEAKLAEALPLVGEDGRLNYKAVATELDTERGADKAMLADINNAVTDLEAVNTALEDNISKLIVEAEEALRNGNQSLARTKIDELASNIDDFGTDIDTPVKTLQNLTKSYAKLGKRFSEIYGKIIPPQLSKFVSLKNNVWLRVDPKKPYELNYDDFSRFQEILGKDLYSNIQGKFVHYDVALSRVTARINAEGGKMDGMALKQVAETMVNTIEEVITDIEDLTEREQVAAYDMMTEWMRWNVMQYGVWRRGGMPTTLPDYINKSGVLPDVMKKRMKKMFEYQKDGISNHFRIPLDNYSSKRFYSRNIILARNDFMRENEGLWWLNKIRDRLFSLSYLSGKQIDKQTTADNKKANHLRYRIAYKDVPDKEEKTNRLFEIFKRVLAAVTSPIWATEEFIRRFVVGKVAKFAWRTAIPVTISLGIVGQTANLLEEGIEGVVGNDVLIPFTDIDIDAGSRISSLPWNVADLAVGGPVRWVGHKVTGRDMSWIDLDDWTGKGWFGDRNGHFIDPSSDLLNISLPNLNLSGSNAPTAEAVLEQVIEDLDGDLNGDGRVFDEGIRDFQGRDLVDVPGTDTFLAKHFRISLENNPDMLQGLNLNDFNAVVNTLLNSTEYDLNNDGRNADEGIRDFQGRDLVDVPGTDTNLATYYADAARELEQRKAGERQTERKRDKNQDLAPDGPD